MTRSRRGALRNLLQRGLATSLPATLAFDHPTFPALVDYLAREVLRLAPAPDPAPRQAPAHVDPDLATLLHEVDALDDDELETLLRRRPQR